MGTIDALNHDESHKKNEIVITAFISALVEGVRHLGPKGTNEWALYQTVARMTNRKAFDLIIAELIEQKTFRREGGNRIVYCGPSPMGK